MPVNAPPLIINATLKARAECQVESGVVATLNPSPNNCRGNALTEGLAVGIGVVGGAAVPLVSASLIEAEAVARCVGGRGQVSGNSRLVALQVAGQDLAGPVTSALQPVLELTGPGGALAGVVSIAQNQVTTSGDGVAVNALRIQVLPAAAPGGIVPDLSDLLPDLPLPGGGATAPAADIIVSHAEARMPTPCGVPVQVQGVEVVGPVEDLPRTGSNEMTYIPLGLGMLASAGGVYWLNRRARRPGCLSDHRTR